MQSLSHAGRCGPRHYCHRPECRKRFGDIKTVEVVGSDVYYYCHRAIDRADEVTLGMLRDAA